MTEINNKKGGNEKAVDVESKPPKPPPTRLVFGKSNKDKKNVEDK
jgi:hypothetical protein